MSLDKRKLQRLIIKQAKFRNVNLSPGATNFLIGQLEPFDEPEEALNIVLQKLSDSIGAERSIEQEDIENVIREIAQQTQEEHDEFNANNFIQIIDCFEETQSLFGNAMDKTSVYRNRYQMIRQRCKNASPIESLAGSEKTETCIMGLLTNRFGKQYLEDLNTSILLDLSNAKYGKGMITDGSFVLVKGVYDEDELVFRANFIELPPIQQREALIETKEISRLLKMEEKAEDAFMVILSDVHLDKPKVMQKLQKIFEGYKDDPPSLFVFIGNFTSKPFEVGIQTKKEYIGYFSKLASLLKKFKTILESSRFVFVPGVNDPGPGNVLPRPKIPKLFTKTFTDKIPQAIFTSNPCRIKFFTKEIIIFREDLQQKLRRHTILNPDETNLNEHLLITVLGNAYLSPLPILVRPVFWQYSKSLFLNPIPHTLIIADKCNQYQETIEDVKCFNPSSFPVDYSFVKYSPITQSCEYFRLKDD